MGLPVLVALVAIASPGLSARLVPLRAVEGEPLPVIVEVDDAARVVGAVRIETRTATGAWVAVDAQLDDVEGRWRAVVPALLVPPAGSEVAIRTAILGTRGGLLLDLGFDEPMTAIVISAAGAQVEDRVLRAASTAGGGALDQLVAYVGAEGRVGSGARVRVVLAVGVALTTQQELTVGVSLGPAFSRPVELAEGGPIVLGVEAGWRVFTQEPRFLSFAPFFEVGVAADLRLPGFDPGLAARLGASVDLGLETRLDLAIGGGPVLRALTDDASVGFAGGGRMTLRFGGGGAPGP